MIPLKNFIRDFLSSHKKRQPDWQLVGIILFLTLFGLVMLSSASAAVSWQKYQNSYWMVKHQFIFGFLPGIILFWFFSRFDYKKLKKLAATFLFISVGLLLLVFIPGIGASYNTVAKSWINILGFSVQPAELVKLSFLIYLASWLSSRREHGIRDLHHGFLPFIFVLMIILGLVMLQPDFGTMSIIVAMAMAVYFVGGGRLKHISWITGLGAVALFFLIKMSPDRTARLTTFMHPELDPLFRGYQINQALLAIGSGGWFGRGLGHSRQKFAYLPEVAGDSVFAVLAEELGFFISALVVLIFCFLAVKGFRIAKQCDDQFGKLLAIGITVWFSAQVFCNIGGISGIMPLTGVPLPFISYGGTALITCLAAAGILVNISRGEHRA